MAKHNIVLLGAGVSGLSAALELSKNLAYSVTVIAKHMPGDSDAEYASPWAGAAILPFSEKREEAQQYDADTWHEFKRLAEGVPEAGVGFQDAMIYTRHDDRTMNWFLEPDSKKPWFVDALPNYKITNSSLPPDVATAISFTTITINPTIYLPYLVSQCLKAGVSFKRRIIDAISEATQLHHSGRPADLIVNCTGLGSLKLGGVEDRDVYPARGQVVVVRDYPHRLMALPGTSGTEDADTYMIQRPAAGGTVLGGTYQPNNWDPEPNLELGKCIMQRCAELSPTLTNGKGIDVLSIVRHDVGFRPARTGGVRVQAEDIDGLKVVHNYGHGGGGYQASWGCAQEAVRLVEESLTARKRTTDE